MRSRAPVIGVSVSLALAWLALLLIPTLATAQRTRKEIVRATMPAVTMVLAVKSEGGKLVPIASGSGTIVDADGSVLTNVHVISDEQSKTLHELFVIGRFRAADREPEFVCAGVPARGKLKPALDLALIKCDRDMNLRPWTPSGWPTVPIGRSEEIVPGEQILVLGYPNVGGSTIQVTQGLLSGWMGEGPSSSQRAYMKTDASITHGNSGGTAIDETGKLVGVPTAFRVTTAKQGEVVVTAGKVGLIRPIEHARDLIAVARSGWKPTEKTSDPSTDPGATASDPPATDEGVRIVSRVVDAASRKPIGDAFIIVFQPGVKASDVDLDDLESQALSWGQTNAGGEFALREPVPRGGRYTVAVLARDYKPLVVDGALVVDEHAPAQLDPWGMIRLERR